MRLSLPALACLLGLCSTGAAGQDRRHLFTPLLADPKQPHFFAAWLWFDSPTLTGQVANVGLGEDITLARGRDDQWEVGVAAGVFSQFNLRTRSIDLINTDFVIGFPLARRFGPVSARLRLYHQSSHLGDEFILGTNPTRVNLSFEALELLIARDFGDARAYGGGEYIVRHEPADLESGLLHGGVEYRQPMRSGGVLRLPGVGPGRLVAALDVKSTEERRWSVGWSVRAGIEFRTASEREGMRLLSVQLQAYSGPAPYGQFYQEDVRMLGLGIHLGL